MTKNPMFTLTYGLFIVTAQKEGIDNGCLINTATQVSSAPNRISISVNKTGYTHELLQGSDRFALSVLDESADFALIERFGHHSGRDTAKFADFPTCARTPSGLYYVTAGTNAVLSVKTEKTIDLDSHTLFIGSVTDMLLLSDKPSMTYAYYGEHVKPKPTAKASDEPVWRCTVCGYEYHGETIPADFICPLCKHPVSDFVKVD